MLYRWTCSGCGRVLFEHKARLREIARAAEFLRVICGCNYANELGEC